MKAEYWQQIEVSQQIYEYCMENAGGWFFGRTEDKKYFLMPAAYRSPELLNKLL